MGTLDASYLKSLRTRELLSIFQRARGYLLSGYHYGTLDREKDTHVDAQFFGYENWTRSLITLADMRAELATREHVPNKEEAKKIRQNKAKAKKNR